MKNIINWTKTHTTTLLVIDMLVALVLGIYFPEIFSFLKKYALVASFLMIYPIMTNTNLMSIKDSIYNIKFISFSLIFHFIVSPLILFLIIKLMVPNQLVAAGLMFIVIMPASGIAVIWTKLAKGATRLAIVIMAISSIVAIFTIPIETHYIIGHFAKIPLQILINSTLILLLLPIVFGYLTRLSIIKIKGEEKFIKAKPYIGFVSTFGLLTIIFIAFGMKGKVLLSQPFLVLEIASPMILYYLVGFTLMTWLGIKSKFSRQDIIAFNYGSLAKNRSMAAAIAIVSLNPLSVTAIALAGVLAQMPMMVGYGKVIPKILDKYLK